MLNYKFKIGQLIYLDEQSFGIRYHNIKYKGKRPFIVLNWTKQFITIVPCSSYQFDTIWEKITFFDRNLQKDRNSYVMITLPTIIRIEHLIKLQSKKLVEIHNTVALKTSQYTRIKHHYNIWNKLK